MKRVLITGSSGFVGSNLLRRLVNNENGNEIHIFIRESSNLWRIRNVLDKVNVHIVDLKDRALSKIKY